MTGAGPEPDGGRLEELGEHIDEARRTAESDGGTLDLPDERTLNDPDGDGEEGVGGAVPA